MIKILKQTQKQKRKKRVSSRYFGTLKKPRVVVCRSNKYLYAQIIDDENRKTLMSFFCLKKIDEAKKMGKNMAEFLLKKEIREAVFDRGSLAYHGRVAALANGLREGGIKI